MRALAQHERYQSEGHKVINNATKETHCSIPKKFLMFLSLIMKTQKRQRAMKKKAKRCVHFFFLNIKQNSTHMFHFLTFLLYKKLYSLSQSTTMCRWHRTTCDDEEDTNFKNRKNSPLTQRAIASCVSSVVIVIIIGVVAAMVPFFSRWL